jgi:hypothetical protein
MLIGDEEADACGSQQRFDSADNDEIVRSDDFDHDDLGRGAHLPRGLRVFMVDPQPVAREGVLWELWFRSRKSRSIA